MRVKHQIDYDNDILAMRYDSEKEELMLAGKKAHLDKLLNIMTEIFNREDYISKKGNKITVRLFAPLSLSEYAEGKKEMKANNIYLTSVTSFGRLVF